MPRKVPWYQRCDDAIQVPIQLASGIALREIARKFGSTSASIVRHCLVVAMESLYPGEWRSRVDELQSMDRDSLLEIRQRLIAGEIIDYDEYTIDQDKEDE